ncbi:MAG TPA: hypothetical protein PLD95_02400 [bacterium]|jgi:hypothetical protein|nr:MAG: hypothetical protein BWX59_00813 [Bacteroidetes bacterium ADurb.Bin028]HOG38301.1 hypothetical protein [bacterium]
MRREMLQVTWKIIRRKGNGRTPETYCTYIAENEKYKHKLKTIEGTKLFDLLSTHKISKRPEFEKKVMIDGMYRGDKLIFITNPRIF